ncbi:MAG: DoxX family membrane protein [Cyclobacteriaceae bacterium]|nr:DoxX family membrane protein [Cyclobacteriaceae bacterium]
MKAENPILPPGIVLNVLRIMIGWHFLYEGVSKTAMENWSSYAYLMESKWLLSGFFHWIIAHPSWLTIVDILNIWGLILIGLGLFLGMFTRVASITGIGLLLLYYIANPPFIEASLPFAGSRFFLNLNLIEAGILLLILFQDRRYIWGIDRLVKQVIEHRQEKLFPKQENKHVPPEFKNSRRELIKDIASIPVLGFALFGMARKYGWLSFEEKNMVTVDATTTATVLSAKSRDMRDLKGKVPSGKIKHVEMSRIIPGGNLVAGFAHARDLIYVSNMIKNYFTDEKVIETLWLYEACGINTTIMRTDEQTIRILNKYRKRGGKIKWLAQTYPIEEDYTNVKMAIDEGAVGAFVMGGIADRLVAENRLEQLAGPVEYIRSQGLIAGTAGHAIQVPMACMNHGIEVDFFMKTFHHDRYWSAHPFENRKEYMHDIDDSSLDRNQYHDNLWCPSADEVSAFFRNSNVPWIAYKVLAAGAIDPEEGFRHAFESGADFICVGMFDFQVIPNANIVYSLLNNGFKRERQWYA